MRPETLVLLFWFDINNKNEVASRFEIKSFVGNYDINDFLSSIVVGDPVGK